MKLQLLLIAIICIALESKAQWSQTNLGGSKAITVLDGKVFALTGSQGLQVSSDNGDSWSSVNTTTIEGRMDHLVSSGDRIYIATYGVTTANGIIYYSTDLGATWQTDTVGLPDALFQPSGKTDIHTLVAYGDGELIVTCSGIDAYMHKNITDAQWEIIPELASLDPDDYIGSGDTVLAFGSSPTIKISTDNAHTFTDIVASGLPNYFVPTGVFWDRGKRMFLGVNAPILNKTQFYYSDDIGASWDSFNIAPFVGVDFTSSRQKLTAVFGLDDNVYFALYNDHSNSTAEVFSSSNGGVNFAKDTTGLAVDGFSTEFVTMFMYNDQRLFSVHSNTDVHFTGLAGPITGKDELQNTSVLLYPNPSDGLINFSEPVSYVRVLSADGTVVQTVSGVTQTIDLSNKPSGLYLIDYKDSLGDLHRQKVVVR